jgi:uncharacterized protein YkwD
MLLLALAILAAPAHAAACAGANVIPTTGHVAPARSATLCLLNQQRRAHHLPLLRPAIALQRAAASYSHQMIRQRFFDHIAPDGTTFDRRIRAAGYGAYRTLAENLAWGAGSQATPARIVDEWMHSPMHRHNILDGRLRDIGIGIQPGAPLGARVRPAATYTTDFGRRR